MILENANLSSDYASVGELVFLAFFFRKMPTRLYSEIVFDAAKIKKSRLISGEQWKIILTNRKKMYVTCIALTCTAVPV